MARKNLQKKLSEKLLNIREEKGKISRTTELADIVKKAIPKFDSKKNPATKTFQAIRIKVNEELLEIETGFTCSIRSS